LELLLGYLEVANFCHDLLFYLLEAILRGCSQIISPLRLWLGLDTSWKTQFQAIHSSTTSHTIVLVRLRATKPVGEILQVCLTETNSQGSKVEHPHPTTGTPAILWWWCSWAILLSGYWRLHPLASRIRIVSRCTSCLS
jgi:hypothetical protein